MNRPEYRGTGQLIRLRIVATEMQTTALMSTLRAAHDQSSHLDQVAEICSRAVHWVHFHFGKSCKDSLLELSNARIARIAELYALHRDAVGGNGPALASTHVLE